MSKRKDYTRHELGHCTALAIGLQKLMSDYPGMNDPAIKLKNWTMRVTKSEVLPLRVDHDMEHPEFHKQPQCIVGACAIAGAFIDLSEAQAKRFLWQPDYQLLESKGMSNGDFEVGRIKASTEVSDREKVILMATHIMSRSAEFEKATNRLSRLFGYQECIWINPADVGSYQSRAKALAKAANIVGDVKRAGGLAA